VIAEPEIHSQYQEVLYENLQQQFNGSLILLVTATELETEELHKKFSPFPGYTKILKVYSGSQTYFFGVFGKYKVAHVQCTMGSMSRSGSITTVMNALDVLKSKVVIMVGIAFGVNEDSQRIGDVLVAESIIPYNNKRIGENDTIQRGIESPTSKILLNRFKSNEANWEYLLDGNMKATMIPTRLLSGEELIDNRGYRNKLIADFPQAKGGEMEGAGVYAACDGRAQWIVITGICDYANGEMG
jgi:nucleoside phosphorylase